MASWHRSAYCGAGMDTPASSLQPPASSFRWLPAVGLSGLAHIFLAVMITAWLFPPIELPRISMVEVAGVPWVPPEPVAAPPQEPEVTEPPVEEPEIPSTPPSPPPRPLPEKSRPIRQEAKLVQREQAPRPPRKTVPPPDEQEPEDESEPSEATGDSEEATSDESAEPMLELPESLAAGELEGVTDGAKVALLVRTARVAASPQARDIRKLVRSVPGFGLYMGESAFDPLTDFNWMLVRTPNLRSETQTIIISEPADVDRVPATLERLAPRGESMRRTEGEGYTLHKVPATANQRQRSLSWATFETEGLLAIGPSGWVRRATRSPEELTGDPYPSLEEVRLRGEEPDLVLAADHVEAALVVDGRELAAPPTVVLGVWFGEPSTLVARAWFENPEAAVLFIETLRGRLNELDQHPWARLIDLPRITRELEIERDGAAATGTLVLTAAQMVRILRLATLLLRGDGGESNNADTN